MPTPIDPYASHLPALKAFSKRLKPLRHVLEFGAGLHSTRFFLRLVDLEELVSVEKDPEWIDRIYRVVGDDERWVPVQPTRDDYLDNFGEAFPLNGFDLILVDDGTTAKERVRTLRWVLGQPHPPVLVHDAEVPEYAELIEGTRHAIYRDLTPYTAVVW